jgi:UDP:flavonoid glycosyltransferase YjiC (YdhE family)
MICLMPQCGYLSETSRMIELHRALVARGTPVRMALHGGTYEWLIAAAGIDYDLVGPRMSAERSAQLVRDSPGLGSVRQSVYTPAELVRYARAEADYFGRIGVRVVVTGFTLTTLLSSRLAGIRLVTEHNGSWLPPVWERGLLPAPIDPLWRWMRYLPPGMNRRAINAAPARVHWYCGPINAAARRLGVEPIPSMAALTLGDLALLTEVPQVVGLPAEVFQAWRPPRRSGYRAGTRLAVAGPIYARLPMGLPAHVRAFLDREGACVYVALTSTPQSLVAAAIRAVAAAGVRVLVAATVHDSATLEGVDRTGRVMVAGVLPSHLVMPRVDLAVTTAGQGSVQTAMAAGTPLIGIPLQPEQDLNIVLLERLGAARRLSPRAVGSRAMTNLVRAMLTDSLTRRAAARVRSWYDGVDGPGCAAALIENQALHSAERPG